MRNILATVLYCIIMATVVPSAYAEQTIEVYKNAN